MADIPAGYTGELKVITDVEISNTVLHKYYAKLEFKDGRLVKIKEQGHESQKVALTIPVPQSPPGQ